MAPKSKAGHSEPSGYGTLNLFGNFPIVDVTLDQQEVHLVQVPLREQQHDDHMDEKTLFDLRQGGKRKKVSLKSHMAKKKVKTPITKLKPSATLSIDKVYSLKFYFVISSQCYDTIYNCGCIAEVTLNH